MIAVCFHFEAEEANIYSGREIDFQMWRESLQIFGVDKFLIVDTSKAEIYFQSEKIEKEEYYTLKEALEAYPNSEIVYCDPKGKNSLIDFEHPTGDVIYVFGPDSTGLNLKDYSEAVSIPSTNEYKETWAVCAANVVMYDRVVKK